MTALAAAAAAIIGVIGVCDTFLFAESRMIHFIPDPGVAAVFGHLDAGHLLLVQLV